MTFILLGFVAFIVGLLIGTVGVGGILLIPAIAAFAGLSTQISMATALFSFIFTGLVGTYLYQRRGTIDWSITIPVCLGALVFGYLGALANSKTNPVMLNFALACIIIFAGAYAFKPACASNTFAYDKRSTKHRLLLIAIGAAVGFGSGLTGVGGPVLSVPMMVIIGFAPLTSIATAQVIQIAAAASGTIGNLAHGAIDFSTAGWITILELFGVAAGVRLAHSCQTRTLRMAVAVICMLVGGMIFVRSSSSLMAVWDSAKLLAQGGF